MSEQQWSELPRAPAPGEAEQQPPPAMPYASWGHRVGAYLLDGVFATLIAAVIAAAIGFAIYAAEAADPPRGENSAFIALAIFLGLSFVVPWFYFTIFHGSESGQTPGKKALGIRVRRSDGSRLGYGRALGRYGMTFLLAIAGAVTFGIGSLVDYLWPLWDDENQTLHDKAVDSVVLRG